MTKQAILIKKINVITWLDVDADIFHDWNVKLAGKEKNRVRRDGQLNLSRCQSCYKNMEQE